MPENNLKQILNNEGLTQVRVSKASGISSSTLSKVYNERHTPTLPTMAKIVKGINRLVGEERYEIKDLFPRADDDDDQE